MPRQADRILPGELVSLPQVGYARWYKVAILKIATTSRRPADSLSKSRRAVTRQQFGNTNFF